MYYFVYKTTNLINGKIYIGIHRTENLNDNYLGSGKFLKQAIKKYGRKNFKREILYLGDSYEDISNKERELVTEEFCKSHTTYNTELGGKGGKIWTDELKQKMSDTKKKHYQNGKTPWNKGKTIGCFLSEEQIETNRQRMSGSNNHMFGVNVSSLLTKEQEQERRRKLSESNKKPKSKKDKYKLAAQNRIWLVTSNGYITHTTNKNDYRLLSTEWQRGRVWKD